MKQWYAEKPHLFTKEDRHDRRERAQRKAHAAQRPRHHNELGEGACTAQRSDALAQQVVQTFPKKPRCRPGPDKIAVSGAPGAGATFSFTVVVGRSKPPAASEEAPKSALAGRRLDGARLPTVEDDRNDQQAAGGHPEKPGIAVSPAAEPAAIGALLARLRPFPEEHERVPDDLLRELAALARGRPPVAPFARLLR